MIGGSTSKEDGENRYWGQPAVSGLAAQDSVWPKTFFNCLFPSPPSPFFLLSAFHTWDESSCLDWKVLSLRRKLFGSKGGIPVASFG